MDIKNVSSDNYTKSYSLLPFPLSHLFYTLYPTWIGWLPHSIKTTLWRSPGFSIFILLICQLISNFHTLKSSSLWIWKLLSICFPSTSLVPFLYIFWGIFLLNLMDKCLKSSGLWITTFLISLYLFLPDDLQPLPRLHLLLQAYFFIPDPFSESRMYIYQLNASTLIKWFNNILEIFTLIPILVNGTSVYPLAQARNSGASFGVSFFSMFTQSPRPVKNLPE